MTHNAEEPSTLVSHLIELRNRLLYALIAVTIVFIGLLPFANEIYHFVATPLLAYLPEGGTMIATEVATPFLTPFKLSFFIAFVLALPFVLYQIWAFLAPALYDNEKSLILPLVISSVVLFYTGVAFCYYVVFPLVFGFFTSMAPEGVTVMTDISSYLNFVLKLFLAFGIAFEIPVAIILLIYSRAISAESLAKKRPYIIVSCFILGMFLTPPDVVSQILLAVPMWILYESGLLIGKQLSARKTLENTDGHDIRHS